MEKQSFTLVVILLAVIVSFAGCSLFGKKKETRPFVSEVIHPEWSENIVLYEVNVRQFTEEGTFNAFAEHLPRLNDLGIDVLWFMPTYPIGVVNRKEPLGSYYSVKDFMDVNPEFGTLEDFGKIISKAHDLGMYVMLDWVPNHTSWDNQLAVDHPEFYVRDSTGKFTPPVGTDWTDVIQLDWSQEGLHDYMINAMAFWVQFGVDGFRVDHPHITPPEFWERARTELSRIKPVLMLAEHEAPGGFMVKGFDMNYAWELHHLMNSVAQGKAKARTIIDYFHREWATYPNSVYRLQFLTNHDENSWAGTIDSLMGDAQKMFAAMIFTAQSVPLIYSGQEACLDKKLKFFERDPIIWKECELTEYYKDLIKLKKENKALWNGDNGGPMVTIKTCRDKKVLGFSREKDGNRVVVFLNLTGKSVKFKARLQDINGDYSDYFTGNSITLKEREKFTLESWGYRVYVVQAGAE